MRTQSKEVTRTYVVSDIHGEFQDPQAVQLFLRVVADQKPNRVVILGDAVDFYCISRWSKDPKRMTPDGLGRDLGYWYDFASKLRKAVPFAEVDFVDGNHEDRLRRYVWDHAAALNDFIDYEKIMKFEEYKIKYRGKKFMSDGILFTHGSLIRQDPGASAKAEFFKHGCNGISGHTHRLGDYIARGEDSLRGWWESGCLCSLNPIFMELPNWALGWLIILNMPGRDSFDVKQVRILPKYKCWVGEKLYTNENAKRVI